LEETVNKLELISTLREKTNLSKIEAAAVVELFINKMSDALACGDRVEIRGLCSFYVKKYKSYIGRNPWSGKKVPIKPKKLPFFRAGRELKARVNQK
jgi:integration host factor subunit beta